MNPSEKQPKKHLIVVGGPTAVGKTSLAIKLAQHYKTEIISADSRQFYREITIGTAKPDAEELLQARHHFIDNLSIHQHYTVGDYEKEVLALLNELFKKYDHVVMVGGSGLYIKAVCDGLDEMPETLPGIRDELNQLFKKDGISVLQNMLKKADPDYYEKVDRKNHIRLIRALEVIKSTGRRFSEFRRDYNAERQFNVTKLALEIERHLLYDRIDRRMDEMIKKGLFEEAGSLLPLAHLNALQTVGYSEIFGYIQGEYEKEEAIRLLKRNSRRYAKRQLTWFRKDGQYSWFHPSSVEDMIKYVDSRTPTS